MKKLSIIVALLIATVTAAQKSLFENISTTDQYIEYFSNVDEEGDGTYIIKERRFVAKFYTEYLPTGEGCQIKSIADEGNSKGHVIESFNAIDKDVVCNGYPYESILRDTDSDRQGFVAIGDYVFLLGGISDDGTSFKYLSRVYIKKGAKSADGTDGKKKKKTYKCAIKFFDA